MIQKYESIIIQVICKALVPFIQLFGLYVIVFVHYGPGGGFQGGVILGASIILQRLYLGREVSHRKFSPNLAMMLGAIGMLIYMLAGLVPMATGGAFLDYGRLPIPGVTGAPLRSLGILIVESGIAIAVFGTVVLLFDRLAGGKE